ncbi:hypothetical protein BU17DRAFT_61859 [Hysterangium stoloniferum]|nr:hypothetical protein BU17DRAFT_61859 [Hysterangium stoloniferum]
MASGRKYINDIAGAPYDVLSFAAALEERVFAKYLLGPAVVNHPYHVEFPLLKGLSSWRVDQSRRLSSGGTDRRSRLQPHLPWFTPFIKYGLDAFHARQIINRFPGFLRGIAAQLPTVPETNDFLSWAMDTADGEERSPRQLTNRILLLNFAAFHTTSLVFILNQNISHHFERETIVKEDGTSKMALSKMHKLDSVLRETHRMNGIGAQFPPLLTPPMDDEIYTDAGVFNGFQFSKIQGTDGKNVPNQFVSTNPDYIGFGHGKHACRAPGKGWWLEGSSGYPY